MTFHSITKIGKFLEANLAEVPERPGKGDEAWNFFKVFFFVLYFCLEK